MVNVDNNFVFDIPDYNTVLSSRVHKRGGGVLIYVNKNISFNILSLITNKLFDSIIIELILNNNKKIIFSSIYRTTNIDNDSFTMFFNLLFPTLFKYVDRKMIICGDFNIDLKNFNIY